MALNSIKPYTMHLQQYYDMEHSFHTALSGERSPPAGDTDVVKGLFTVTPQRKFDLKHQSHFVISGSVLM